MYLGRYQLGDWVPLPVLTRDANRLAAWPTDSDGNAVPPHFKIYDSSLKKIMASHELAAVDADNEVGFHAGYQRLGPEFTTGQYIVIHEYGISQNDLFSNLVLYWKMDEASGAAVATYGGLDLEDINTVTSAAGIIGTARDFTTANDEYFVDKPGDVLPPQVPGDEIFVVPEADERLTFGDGRAFSFSVWVYENNFTNTIIYKGVDKPALTSAVKNLETEYKLTTSNDGGNVKATWTVYVRNTRDATVPLVNADCAVTLTGVSTGEWYHLVVTHDADGVNKIYGNGVAGTASAAEEKVGGILTKVVPQSYPRTTFFLGADANGFGGRSTLDGRMDEVSVWKKALSANQVSELYNSGAGFAFPFGGNAGDRALIDTFDVVADGEDDGAYVGVHYYDRPHANFVVGATDAARFEFRRNPKV